MLRVANSGLRLQRWEEPVIGVWASNMEGVHSVDSQIRIFLLLY